MLILNNCEWIKFETNTNNLMIAIKNNLLENYAIKY